MLVSGAKAKAVGVTKSFDKVPCRFFLRDQCNKGDACLFSHAPVSEEQKQDSVKPASTDRSKTPHSEHNKRSSSRVRSMHCFNFVKGSCANGENCSWAHLTAEEVAANKAKAKAKAASPVTSESAVVTATPCVAVFKDDQESESYVTAVVCAEICALIEDDGENKIPIGRIQKWQNHGAAQSLDA